MNESEPDFLRLLSAPNLSKVERKGILDFVKRNIISPFDHMLFPKVNPFVCCLIVKREEARPRARVRGNRSGVISIMCPFINRLR